MMRALLDDEEREAAASAVAFWLIEHAVEATAHPTGTNFVPGAIDREARIIGIIVQEPADMIVGEVAISPTLQTIPMLATAS